jgi:hypothetical protein
VVGCFWLGRGIEVLPRFDIICAWRRQKQVLRTRMLGSCALPQKTGGGFAAELPRVGRHISAWQLTILDEDCYAK